MAIPQKIQSRGTICSSNATAGYISEGNEINVSKRHLHSHVRYCTPQIAKIWNQPKCPSIAEWIRNCVICVCTYMYIYTMKHYLAIKKRRKSYHFQ
jgi:hypothetical protein